MRAYAETHASRWFILSDKYGLIHPDTVIEYYEQTLKDLSRKERRAWAQNTFSLMKSANLLLKPATFLWLAGSIYKEDLADLLKDFDQEDPLSGMRIGERLGWLKAQAAIR